MVSRDSLSPRTAVALGVLCVAMGFVVVALALGIVPAKMAPDTPRWLGVAAGLIFVLGGLALVLGYAVAGGAGPDGDLPPGTPFGVRLIQYALGLGIVGLLTAIAGWIAFGPGRRRFAVTGLPFVTPHGAEWAGRVVFGLGALLMTGFFLVAVIVGARRLRRRG